MWLSPVEQAGGRVEADPAGAGQIDLAPGMQVGEVLVGAGRAVERDEVGLELDQVAGDEARREAEMAEDLDEQPARVAARALGEVERLVRRLDARLHADDVADLALQARVQGDDEIDRVGLRAVDRGEEARRAPARRLGLQVDRQVVADLLRIGERPLLRRRLDEEVERIVDRHVGDEIDLDLQLA